MKSEIKKLENSIIEIIIEEDASFVAKYRKDAIKDLTKNADIKGFRKGATIPESIIVQNYGEEMINAMAIERAIDVLYRKALRENNILPTGQAAIKEVVSQSPLKVVVEVEVYPEVEIAKKDYEKISIKKTATRVTQKEVDASIEDIQKRLTNFVEAEAGYKAQMGDKVTVDTDGYEGDTLLDQTSMRAYPLVLGSNTLVPGFEEGLVDLKEGDEKDLDITFPKDYHNADFAGKKTVFKAKVIKIEKADKPEITPEFTKAIRGKELDLEGFKALIKEEITDTKKQNARIQDEEKLLEELMKISKVEPGASMLKGSMDKVFAEIKQNIEASGANPSDYIKSLNMTEEQYKETHVKPVAEKRLKGELILHTIKDMENIEVSNKDIEKEVKVIMSKYESEQVKERLSELYVEGSKYYEELRTRLAYTKLIDSFIK